jgi:hypothetical protein
MSLVAVITLDLSKWTSFLTTPAEVTIPTLFMVSDSGSCCKRAVPEESVCV